MLPKYKKNNISDNIIKQWHPTLNGGLNPEEFDAFSKIKIWWQCPVAKDHIWQISIAARSRGSGCPCCRGLKTVQSNCLAAKYPKLIKEWHPTLNGNLTPFNCMPKSNKKIWWQCLVQKDHVWQTSIATRTEGCGCPYCGGKKLAISNCLATTYPEIAKQWHPTLNGNLTPFDVIAGSKKKFWWQCPVEKDHVWEAVLSNRTILKSGCPCCDGCKIVPSNCLATLNPIIAKQWHPTLNGNLTPFDIGIGSTLKIWWQCPVAKDHIWQSSVISRTLNKKTGCPCCSGKKIVESNCLATICPNTAKLWHPTLNGNLTPFDVSIATHKYGKIWWLGKCGHEWQAHIDQVIRKHGCPICCESKGETAIREYLDFNKIEYKRQYRFESCKNIYKLPFDFAIFIEGKIKLIEFHGIQHYEYNSFLHKKNKQQFFEGQKRDEIKSNWCILNKMPLLTIPYWQFNKINKLLGKFTKKDCN